MKICGRNSRGFTLVELLIIVAMIGVVSAIAFPTLLSQLPRWRTNGVTRDVSGKLMLARLKAIQNNNRYAVEFSFGDRDSFKIMKYDTDINGWVDDGFESRTTGDVDIVLAGGGCTNRVIFNIDGTAGGCDPVWVKTKDSVQVRKLGINTSTGKVTVYNCNVESC